MRLASAAGRRRHPPPPPAAVHRRCSAPTVAPAEAGSTGRSPTVLTSPSGLWQALRGACRLCEAPGAAMALLCESRSAERCRKHVRPSTEHRGLRRGPAAPANPMPPPHAAAAAGWQHLASPPFRITVPQSPTSVRHLCVHVALHLTPARCPRKKWPSIGVKTSTVPRHTRLRLVRRGGSPELSRGLRTPPQAPTTAAPAARPAPPSGPVGRS